MKSMHFLEKVEVQSFIDRRGNLGVSELGVNPKFIIKRIYYINRVPSEASRGAHGHKQLQQIFYALSGSFHLMVTDGVNTDSVTVSEMSNGYFLPAGLWRDLDNFSSDCVCLVLASEPYDKSDYIHDYEEFRNWRALK